MRIVPLLAAVSEGATGLALVIVPSLVGRLLLGQELVSVAIPVARVLGIALIALGVSCWPCRTALCGMLTYSALATGYLAWLGICGEWVGALLWPAVVLHAIMTLLLGNVWRINTKTGPSSPPVLRGAGAETRAIPRHLDKKPQGLRL